MIITKQNNNASHLTLKQVRDRFTFAEKTEMEDFARGTSKAAASVRVLLKDLEAVGLAGETIRPASDEFKAGVQLLISSGIIAPDRFDALTANV